VPVLSNLNIDDLAATNPFDGKTSIKGKTWSSPVVDEARVEYLVQAHSLPEMVARLLVIRDLDKGDVEGFLNPTLAKNFPDPFSLQNMEQAASFIAQAIQDNKKIGILADFDVDGATSYATLSRFLMAVGCTNVPCFIPDRLNDGYGPSDKGFDSLKEQGAEIAVVLDCGVTSVAPIAHAKSIGLDVVVVDHHEPDEILPDANFIINPKLEDDTSELDYLAAVGVTFLLCIAINSKLRAAGFYTDRDEPAMREALDLVALGTVCDMVPLVNANRLFVKHGFPMMAQGRNIGLNALLSVSKITTMPDPYHAGFMLGPRINAGSRVHQSDLGAQLLSTMDEGEASRIAWLLDDCNEKRKGIQKDMTREAMEKAKAMMIEFPQTSGLVIDGEGWHTGLSGLVSGTIKEKYNKPTCVIAYVENADGVIEGRASGRSVKGVHIADILMSAQKDGLIVKGGGHAMAGGFTIMPDQLDGFMTYFNTQVAAQLSNVDEYSDVEEIELPLAVQGLNIQTAKLLTESLAPFGMAHEEPKTILSNVRIDYADQVGANHLRCTVKDAEGGKGIKAMAFRALESDMGKMLREMAGTQTRVHLRGQVKINEWQGRESVEFHISDAMEA
jgi:single-stranded-DNA-specific exonuclease